MASDLREVPRRRRFDSTDSLNSGRHKTFLTSIYSFLCKHYSYTYRPYYHTSIVILTKSINYIRIAKNLRILHILGRENSSYEKIFGLKLSKLQTSCIGTLLEEHINLKKAKFNILTFTTTVQKDRLKIKFIHVQCVRNIRSRSFFKEQYVQILILAIPLAFILALRHANSDRGLVSIKGLKCPHVSKFVKSNTSEDVDSMTRAESETFK
ncbi:hypothetical protein AGLY_008656 [Aphis glycines]|uniref:Uncharacterized protein n=1 Tax=Aphis glycines TaxID=307491 RepID=A0A6G0TLW6_APHGL|nr:hypothetical protein AGLY_008656 [Aphis glycines]